MLTSPMRLGAATAIMLFGVVLAAFAGFPAEAPTWQRFADAYVDQITVTRAEYDDDDRELRVRAESSSSTSVLSVYNLSGTLLGVLVREDETRHEGRFTVATNPRVITVSSSEGGSATVLVTGDNPPTVTPAATLVTPTTPTATATADTTETPPTPTDQATIGTPDPSATSTPDGPVPTTTATAAVPTPGEGGPHKVFLPHVVNQAGVRGP